MKPFFSAVVSEQEVLEGQTPDDRPTPEKRGMCYKRSSLLIKSTAIYDMNDIN